MFQLFFVKFLGYDTTTPPQNIPPKTSRRPTKSPAPPKSHQKHPRQHAKHRIRPQFRRQSKSNCAN